MKKLLFLLVTGSVLALFLGCDNSMPPDVHDSPNSTDLERKDVLALKHLQIPNVSEDTLASYVMDFINITAASETGTERSVQPATPAITITKTTEIIHPVETGFAETTADKRSARSVISPGQIPFYVFTLENQQTGKTGFALACGDNRIGNVLAVAEEGNYDDDNPFLGVFYSQLNAYVEETIGIYNSVTEADIENALNKINEARYTGPSVPNVPVTDVGRYDFDLAGTVNDKTNNNTLHILETEWHQNDPYNAIVKKKKGYNCVTGCGPVAIAQVMAFHGKPPNSSKSTGYDIEYKWDGMMDGTNDEQVGILMYEIGWHAESIYLGKNGTATLRSGVIKALTAMGYKAPGSFESYNFGKVKSSINEGCPVIADGSDTGINIFGIIMSTPMGGHYWVIDGYRKMSVFDKNDKSKAPKNNEADYIHCNMGWGGSSNGWYFSGIFDTNNIPLTDDNDAILRSVESTDHFYRYGLGILTGIMPK